MKIRIKLANGIEINKEFTAEQLERAEHTKLFRQANSKGIKTGWCDYDSYYFKGCENCRYNDKCKSQAIKKVDAIGNYLNYLKKLN